MRTPVALLLALAALGGCKSTYVAGDMAAAADQREWLYNADGGEAKLAYGTPQSDDVVVMMSCAPGSGQVVLHKGGMRPGAAIELASGDARGAFSGASQADQLSGGYYVEAKTTVQAPVLQRFRQAGVIQVREGPALMTLPASDAERVLIGQFFAACSG